jgi:8-oxo-dGTP diphosphatase
MPTRPEGLMQVAVDAVVFTVLHDSLKLLLIERKNAPFKGSFALPGGFVNLDESLEQAARRELLEETNVKEIFLQQLGAYGDVHRDPRGRVVSVAFLAFISPEQRLVASSDALRAQWHPADALPTLAFDHKHIVDDALRHLRYEIQTTNIAAQILPRRFTLSQLQKLYETVLGKQLDKRNFRKRVQELAILKPTGEQFREGAHRPAELYSFAQQRYTSLKERIQVLLA